MVPIAIGWSVLPAQHLVLLPLNAGCWINPTHRPGPHVVATAMIAGLVLCWLPRRHLGRTLHHFWSWDIYCIDSDSCCLQLVRQGAEDANWRNALEKLVKEGLYEQFVQQQPLLLRKWLKERSRVLLSMGDEYLLCLLIHACSSLVCVCIVPLVSFMCRSIPVGEPGMHCSKMRSWFSHR